MTEPTTRTIKSSEARQNFASLLNQVYKDHERVIIEKSGIPVAALIPADDFERFQRWDLDLAQRRQFLEAFRKNFEGVSPEEIEREVEKGLAEVRAEMRAERLALLNAE